MAALAHKGQVIMGGDNGVTSFNGRNGSILPMAGDYSAEQVNYDRNQTVKQKIDAIGKNLLPYPYVDTTKTTNGITFTVNSDGSVTANGTATGPAELKLMNDAPRLYDGRYILNGCPEGGKDDRYRLTAYRVDSTDGQSGSVFDTGNGVEFTYKNHTGNVFFNVYVHIGTTVSNLTFKPMLRLASDPDNTYQPYAMTNRELTEKVGVWTTPVSCLVGDTDVTITNSAIHTTSTIDIYYETASGNPITYTSAVVTEGQIVITFASALEEAASIKLRITN